MDRRERNWREAEKLRRHVERSRAQLLQSSYDACHWDRQLLEQRVRGLEEQKVVVPPGLMEHIFREAVNSFSMRIADQILGTVEGRSLAASAAKIATDLAEFWLRDGRVTGELAEARAFAVHHLHRRSVEVHIQVPAIRFATAIGREHLERAVG